MQTAAKTVVVTTVLLSALVAHRGPANILVPRRYPPKTLV